MQRNTPLFLLRTKTKHVNYVKFMSEINLYSENMHLNYASFYRSFSIVNKKLSDRTLKKRALKMQDALKHFEKAQSLKNKDTQGSNFKNLDR